MGEPVKTAVTLQTGRPFRRGARYFSAGDDRLRGVGRARNGLGGVGRAVLWITPMKYRDNDKRARNLHHFLRRLAAPPAC